MTDEAKSKPVALFCCDCWKMIEEPVPDCQKPTLIDRQCGIAYEWRDNGWYKADLLVCSNFGLPPK